MQLKRSPPSKAVLAAANTLARIAKVPGLCVLAAERRIFSALLQVVDTAKNLPRNRELLVASLKALSALASDDGVRQRMRARKKWVKKLVGTLQAVSKKRRGAADDPTKSELVQALFGLFEDS